MTTTCPSGRRRRRSFIAGLAGIVLALVPVVSLASPASARPVAAVGDPIAAAARAALDSLDQVEAVHADNDTVRVAGLDGSVEQLVAKLHFAYDVKVLADLVAQRATVDPWKLYQVWSTESEQRMTAVFTALAQVGKPYRSMSKGPDSFDCSGLLHFSWGAAGVAMGADSEQQIRAARAVKEADLRPGDIVYHPGHVGLSLGVGHAIVHAEQTGQPVKVMDWARATKLGSPV